MATACRPHVHTVFATSVIWNPLVATYRSPIDASFVLSITSQTTRLDGMTLSLNFGLEATLSAFLTAFLPFHLITFYYFLNNKVNRYLSTGFSDYMKTISKKQRKLCSVFTKSWKKLCMILTRCSICRTYVMLLPEFNQIWSSKYGLRIVAPF